MAGNLAVLYDVEWQVLRCKMLSANNDYGGWWTYAGAVQNTRLCDKYREDATSTVELNLRRWRITNLCNATLLGYGKREDVPDDCRHTVMALRSRCGFDPWIVSEANRVWNWSRVADQVAELSKENRKMLLDNLKKRVKTSARRNGEADKFKHRKELEFFVCLLRGDEYESSN